jgi:mannosyl-3-phosphoglycerate phosphatase
MIAKQTLVFSDLDGTLLDHFTYESTEALSTIEQLQVAEIPIILTTSKTLAEVNKIQADLHINAPIIIENGAAVFIPKNTFRTQPKDTASSGKYWVKSFCLPRQHWLDVIDNAPQKFKEHYQGFNTLTIDDLADLTGLALTDAELAKDRKYGEPINWLGDESSKAEFIRYLESHDATVLQGGRFFHVAGNSNKGKALTWLTKCYEDYYRTENITTIALGDGKNDIAMLEAADFAVQVRSPVHAFPPLSRSKNIIKTEYYGPAGWAEALQYLLGEQLSHDHFASPIPKLINS